MLRGQLKRQRQHSEKGYRGKPRQCSGFHVASCVRVCESRGRFSRLPQERSGWVRLSERSLSLKRLVSRQIVLWMPCQTVLSLAIHRSLATGFLERRATQKPAAREKPHDDLCGL